MKAVIPLHPNWQHDEEALMRRLQQIISGNQDGPWRKTSGYAWQLDGSNDWWAEIQDGDLIIAHRYSQEKVDALAAWCSILFGPARRLFRIHT